MDPDRLDLIAAVLARTDDAERLDGLLDVTIRLLSASGAAIALTCDGQHQGSVAIRGGDVAVEVDELQFSLGEGPCISVEYAEGPVLEPDLSMAVEQWPAFAPAALARGIAAIFTFPLRIGTAQLGVLTIYRSVTGHLEGADLTDAIAVSHVATHLLIELEGRLPPGAIPERLADVLDHRAEVHQATGMVAAQLGTDAATALGRLRAYAWAENRQLGDVAHDVVTRLLRFDDA